MKSSKCVFRKGSFSTQIPKKESFVVKFLRLTKTTQDVGTNKTPSYTPGSTNIAIAGKWTRSKSMYFLQNMVIFHISYGSLLEGSMHELRIIFAKAYGFQNPPWLSPSDFVYLDVHGT